MKRILIAIAAVVLVGTPSWSGVSLGQSNNIVTRSTRVNSNALREMLTKGLKATRHEQLLYINHVVDLVAQHELPVSYVYASFQYARKRRPDYPFPYFQYSLRALCRRLDVPV